jgi:integrase
VLRHTFLTEAGEFTDPFTLQYVAGHDNIKTTMRYVHPQANAVQKLFAHLADPNREVSLAMRKVGAKSVQSKQANPDFCANSLK